MPTLGINLSLELQKELGVTEKPPITVVLATFKMRDRKLAKSQNRN